MINSQQNNSRFRFALIILLICHLLGFTAYFVMSSRNSKNTHTAIQQTKELKQSPAIVLPIPKTNSPDTHHTGKIAVHTTAQSIDSNTVSGEEPNRQMPQPQRFEILPEQLPEDFQRQLANPPNKLPPDLQAQLDSPPPPIPDDIRQALETQPRMVTIEEVNNMPGGAEFTHKGIVSSFSSSSAP